MGAEILVKVDLHTGICQIRLVHVGHLSENDVHDIGFYGIEILVAIETLESVFGIVTGAK